MQNLTSFIKPTEELNVISDQLNEHLENVNSLEVSCNTINYVRLCKKVEHYGKRLKNLQKNKLTEVLTDTCVKLVNKKS